MPAIEEVEFDRVGVSLPTFDQRMIIVANLEEGVHRPGVSIAREPLRLGSVQVWEAMNREMGLTQE